MDQVEYLLLGVDCQQDFCHAEGALFVPGADRDMARLADLIRRRSSAIREVHLTMDSHDFMDVAHPHWWRDEAGDHPAPFTTITRAEVAAGRWRPFSPALAERMVEYLAQLERNQRYQLCIWPPHCIMGSRGWSLDEGVLRSLEAWCLGQHAPVHKVIKGANPCTEHYSAVLAEVPDPADPATGLNTALLDALARAAAQGRRILVAGEASSHCVAHTVRDLVAHGGEAVAQSLVLISDAMSPVPGCEGLADAFFDAMRRRGVALARCADL